MRPIDSRFAVWLFIFLVHPVPLFPAGSERRVEWSNVGEWRVKRIVDTSGGVIYQRAWNKKDRREISGGKVAEILSVPPSTENPLPYPVPEIDSELSEKRPMPPMEIPLEGVMGAGPSVASRCIELKLAKLDFETARKIAMELESEVRIEHGEDEFSIRFFGRGRENAGNFLRGVDRDPATPAGIHFLEVRHLKLEALADLVREVDPEALPLPNPGDEFAAPTLAAQQVNDGADVPLEGTVPGKNGTRFVLRAQNETIRFLRRFLEFADRGPRQVLLDCILVELSGKLIRKLGIRWDQSNFPISVTPGGAMSLRQMVESGVKSLPIKVSASEESHDFRVLSRPQVKLVEDQSAFLKVTDDVPYSNTTYETDGKVLTRTVKIKKKPIGLRFEVGNLRVYDDRNLTMAVRYEVNTFLSHPDSTVEPLLRKRKTQTVIRAQDGEMQILSGFIQNGKWENHSAIPLLSKLPLIGTLTQGRNRQKKDMETLLLITPHVLPDGRSLPPKNSMNTGGKK